MTQKFSRVRLPQAKKALKHGFTEGYYNLGFVVFVSAISSLVALLIFWVLTLPANLISIMPLRMLLYSPAFFGGYLVSVGANQYAYMALTGQSPAMQDAVLAIRDYWKHVLKLFLINLFVLAVLVSDLVYTWVLAMQKGGILFTALSVFVFYLILIWLMVMIYQMPVLVEAGREAKVGAVLKRALLLTLGNPIFTLGIFLAIIAFTLICAIPLFTGWIALLTGGYAFIGCAAVRELYITYGILPDDPAEPKDRGWNIQDDKPKDQS